MAADAAERRLAQLRQRFAEIGVQQARIEAERGALLLDIRESEELQGGAPEGALHLPRSFLELRIEQVEADRARPIRLLCEAGARSLLACAALAELGYRDLASVAGGVQAWKAAGLPMQSPEARADYFRQRYLRQLQLPQIGESGQRRLAQARVLLVGAGGLGCPAAQYLAAAGVGRLTIIDDDLVELSNLQRQVLHGDARLGMAKVESAAIALRLLNPAIEVRPLRMRLDAVNAPELLRDHDLVIDGSDNFATRYALDAACRAAGLPLVYGAVQGFVGQVSVFWPDAPGGPWPCYRCLFPDPPPARFAPNCAQAGVLGVVPGVVGLLQATEALKLLLGLGQPLLGALLRLDLLTLRFDRVLLPRDPQCPGCGPPVWRRPAEDEPPCPAVGG